MVMKLVIAGMVHFELRKSFQVHMWSKPGIATGAVRAFRAEGRWPSLFCDSVCSPGTGDSLLMNLKLLLLFIWLTSVFSVRMRVPWDVSSIFNITVNVRVRGDAPCLDSPAHC